MPVLSCRPSVGFRGSLAKEAKTWCLVCRTTFGKGKCFCNNKTSDVKAAVKPGTTSVERILEVCTKQTYAASPCALLAALCRIGTSVVCSGYNLITLTTTKEVRVSSFASAHKVCVKSFPPSPLPGPLLPPLPLPSSLLPLATSFLEPKPVVCCLAFCLLSACPPSSICRPHSPSSLLC